MVYRTTWVPLADVLDMLKGVSGDELASKTDICGAIADGKIRIRAIVHRGIETITFSDERIDVPNDLGPDDFDWPNSRPTLPWVFDVPTGIDPTPPSYHPVRRLDLLRADVAIRLVTPAVLEDIDKSKAFQNANAEERESEAIEFLSKRLLNDRLMTREGAKEALKEADFEIGGRAFQERVWPAARKMAGLPQKAPSGRPRKRPPLVLP